MKAWHCFSVSPEYGSLLVYAETRNKARFLASNSPWEWDYVDITAKRANPQYDGLFNDERNIESNDELPKHVEPFYLEEI